MQGLRFTVLAAVLLVAAVIDWRRGVVPNRLTLPAMLVGLVMAMILGWARGGFHEGLQTLGYTTLLTAAALMGMAVIFYAGGIGGGDVKLVGALAAISGNWQCLIGALLYGFVAAMMMALVLMVRHRIVGRTLGRLWSAALTAAARVTPPMPHDSPTVPFAAALCVGGLIAGVEYLLGVPMPWS